MSLAILAAILQPGSKAEHATQRAFIEPMEFYVEAVLVRRKLPTSFRDLIDMYLGLVRLSNLSRFEIGGQFQTHPNTDTLKLEPNEKTDEARKFLNRCAAEEEIRGELWFQSAKQVLQAMKDISGNPSERMFKGTMLHQKILRQPSDGPEFYLIPKWLLRKLVADLKDRQRRRASAGAKKGAETKRLRKAEAKSVK